MRTLFLFVSIAALFTACATRKPDSPSPQPSHSAVVKSQFIYEKAPFPSCHASTIAETKSGLVAAWFGGTAEKNPDVEIWLSRRDGAKWTAPKSVANGIQPDGKRYPTWNPVLFQPRQGPLLLFYKVGPSPSRWWGMMTTSSDGGKTWSEPQRLPKDILGPIKNKPVQLADGTLLCPSSTEDEGWRIHMESTPDLGQTWTRTKALNDRRDFAAIQPTILLHSDKRLQALCRSKQSKITEVWSDDGGKTWSEMKVTSLLNPSAGIDGVTLKDGRHLLVYNPTRSARTPLYVGASNDGKDWKEAVVLENEPGEYSYPAIIQAADGLVHVTYTWKRERIKHVILDPKKIHL
jgi:predicted neuraminidase